MGDINRENPSVVVRHLLVYHIEMTEPFDIKDLIEQMITKFDDSLDPARVTAPFRDSISILDRDYTELIRMSRQRERYNVSWAFSYANEQLQQIAAHIFTSQVKDRIISNANSYRNRKHRDAILKKFSVIERNLTSKIRKTGTSARAFRTAAILISLAEIIITLAIVLIVAEISQAIDRAVSIPQMSMIFIGVFGLLRMFLEKAKQQFLFNWRWNMFQDTVDTAFNGMAVMMTTSYMLAYYIKRGTFLEDIDDLLEKAVDELSRRPDKRELRERRAAHIVARKRQETLERITSLKMHMDKDVIHEAIGLEPEEQEQQDIQSQIDRA